MPIDLLIYFILGFGSVLCALIIAILYKVIKYINLTLDAKERNDIFTRFSEIFAIFTTSKEDAFETLYRQEIYVFFTSKIADQDKKEALKKIEKTFIKRTLDMCGKTNVQELAVLFGDTDAIIINLSSFFAKKITEINSEFTEFEMRDSLEDMTNSINTMNKNNNPFNRIFK